MIERNFAIQRLKKVVAVHTDDALASAESRQPFVGEAAIADEKATGPSCLLLDFAVKGVQVGYAHRLALPLGLNQVGLVAELEAAVDLLAARAEGVLGGGAVGVEEILGKHPERHS